VCRSQFEEEQLKLTQSRLVTLRNAAEDEQRKVAELEDKKRTIQVEITEAQEGIAQLRELLHGLNDVLEEKNKYVDQAKKTHTKAAKILDQALKEISLKVHWLFAQIARSLMINWFIFRMTRLRSWH
jgi:structural maintenance of chromosome 1